MFAFIWILIGLSVGALVKLIMPRLAPGGMLLTILLGITGALTAGFAGQLLGFHGSRQRAGFIMSTLGAILILALYRLIARRHPDLLHYHHHR